jgi:hypothetical protein
MFGSCPSLALPNVGKNWLAKILAKKSLAHIWPNIWQETMREMMGCLLAAKILTTNQT